MLAYVNGRFVDGEALALPINDRSFMYGDGLFETVRITNGQPFLWREHIERLRRGSAFLKIALKFEADDLEQAVRHLLTQNDIPEGVVRIHLSRGSGERGYSMRTATKPCLVITTHKSLHSPPRALRMITSSVRVLADDPLTQHKTANRLPNILARAEADEAGADEALILNHRGEVAEASAANIFIIRGEELVTPPLNSGAVAGTTREFVLKSAASVQLIPAERPFTIADLRAADATFLTSAHWLATEVVALDNSDLATRATQKVTALREICERAAQGR